MAEITEKQINYIKKLGHTGAIPGTVHGGSELIKSLLSKKKANSGHSNIMNHAIMSDDGYAGHFVDHEEEEERQCGLLGVCPDDFGNN